MVLLTAETCWTSLSYFQQDRSHMIVVERFIPSHDMMTRMSVRIFGETNNSKTNKFLKSDVP